VESLGWRLDRVKGGVDRMAAWDEVHGVDPVIEGVKPYGTIRRSLNKGWSSGYRPGRRARPIAMRPRSQRNRPRAAIGS